MLINRRDFSFEHHVYCDEARVNYFECDDLIAPAIRELNLRGYRTEFCCSGHPHMCNGEVHIDLPYILFTEPINEYTSPPDGWYFDDGGRSIRMRYVCDDMNLSLMGALKMITEEMSKLYDWVTALPNKVYIPQHTYLIKCVIGATIFNYIVQAPSYIDAAMKVCPGTKDSFYMDGDPNVTDTVKWIRLTREVAGVTEIIDVGEIVSPSTPLQINKIRLCSEFINETE